MSKQKIVKDLLVNGQTKSKLTRENFVGRIRMVSHLYATELIYKNNNRKMAIRG